MEYLNSQGQELALVNYDVHFALRALSGLLGLWEEAVDLALTVDLDLAKKMANMSPEIDLELRKKLMSYSGKDDIQQAMAFLQQCDLIKIEDILPFFSDFVTIDHFKDAICNSLKEYNQNIQNIKDEMEEATKQRNKYVQEIQSFRNHYTIINSSDTCEVCNITLLIRPFYMFPCHHKFHSDCLLMELGPYLVLVRRECPLRDLVKSEIDNIVASECLYCGENMIRNIDKPFIEDYNYENIMKEWE
ncbi:hypothetical protein NQ317_015833 [Molorchus minor]|uniref:RING-type domain-containing protein n=1 Tax=Molorchus minor TaxID=1323400 RepID=A0ABQ9JP77_9CUCU|nr:hypothetical protein NQ317_015833 [Molorchus minor]